jgi:hypothetical protein
VLYVACMAIRKTCILIEKPGEKELCRNASLKWVGSVKVNLQEIVFRVWNALYWLMIRFSDGRIF